MKKISLKTILLLLIVLGLNPLLFSAADRSDYNLALEKYNNKENEEALFLFEKFISQYPESNKTDDSTWYMGRIYKKLERIDEAEIAFKKVLSDKSSNRYEEAAYDLGKIYYYRGEYREVLELMSFLDEVVVLNSYHLKGLEYRAKAWYRLAYREKLNFNEIDAIDMFERALKIYSNLEPQIDNDSDLSRMHFAMAEIYNHLSDLTYNATSYEQYLDKSYDLVKTSLPYISDLDRPKAEKLILDIEKSKKVGFKGRIVAYAGADTLSSNTFGADIYAKGAMVLPTAGRSSLELAASFSHNSFDFVASNFDKTKTGDTRLVQYAENIGVDLTWRSGTRRNVYNKLNLYGDFQFAEDTRDNYIGAGISDLGSIRFNKNWRFLWDSKFEWRTYPNYLSSGRKLDYLQGSLDPQIRLYALDWLNISLIYGIDIKQYLDSKYHINVLGDPSAINKLNLYNSGEIVFDIEVGKKYNPIFSYKFNYLKTFNYNYVVTESSGDDFVEDYYDYTSHTISFDNNFYLGDRLSVFLDSSLTMTNFINYIARDTNDTYLPNNELRNDISLKLDLGVKYIIWTSPGGTELEARLKGWWDYKVSNMTYNTTFDTNYSYAGVLLGMSVKLP